MSRLTSLLLLLFTTSAFAAGPFIGDEERISAARPGVVLASTADRTLMAWTDGARVRARVGETTIDLGAGLDPSVATDGRDFLIVWQSEGSVVGARWSNPTAVQTYVTNLINMRKSPKVIWNGTTFQVFGGSSPVDSIAVVNGVVMTTWSESYPEGYRCIFGDLFGNLGFPCFVMPAIYVVEWRFSGEHLGVTTFPFRTGYQGITSGLPSGAGAGKNEFLLAWKGPTAIEARRFNTSGATLGFFNVSVANPMSGVRAPQVAWDGTRYLMVFDTLDGTSDIYGAVLIPGEGYAITPFKIAASGENESAPAVTALGPDRFLVAYTIGISAIGTREVSFKEPLPSRRRAAR